MIPTIETQNLTLRMPQPDDFDANAAFMADARATGVGGPMDRAAAWRSFATDLGHWALRGYGMMTIVEKSSGQRAGFAGFWNPVGWPEKELGWAVFNGFEGRSIAYEAATAMRRYAYDTLNWGPLISMITPDNHRSITLAERLGAYFERNWSGSDGAEALIYRHPSREELQ